jgi:hypothetical protein
MGVSVTSCCICYLFGGAISRTRLQAAPPERWVSWAGQGVGYSLAMARDEMLNG